MMRTVFYLAVVDDCEADTLHLAGMVAIASESEVDVAIQDLLKRNMVYGDCDYSVAYTAGHFGEANHEWEFSHYEIYEARDITLPTMVILRYRPAFLEVVDY